MEKLSMLRTTSKRALMDSALVACDGDYGKAAELYDLYASRMDLPDFDPVQPSALLQVRDTASGLFGWVKENKDDILSIVEFVRGLKGSESTGAPLPPLNA